MNKKPFIKIIPIKEITKDTVRRFIAVYIVIFWLFPLMTLIPSEATGISLTNWYLLLIVPIALILTGVIVGIIYGFYPILILGVAVGTFPSALVYGFSPAWQYCIFFCLISGSANLVTEIFKTTSKNNLKWK